MRRKIKISAVLFLLCILCCGCDSWMDGEYLSVTPHAARDEPYENRVIEVRSYTQLRNAFTNLVQTGATDGIISISAFNKGTIYFYIDTAISNVIENTAFGAYAVEKITYEVGTNRGTSVVACQVHYRQGHLLPNEIKHVGKSDEVMDLVIHALENCSESVLVYMDQYEEMDIEGFVTEYSEQYPDRVVEIPRVAVQRYPEKGAERIVEITFDYTMSAIDMHQLRSKIEESFCEAEKSVDGLSDVKDVYRNLYTFLTERAGYRESVGTMPAYDILLQCSGNDREFAAVYARMCNRVGLQCRIVTGLRNGKPWSWNVVRCLENEYHVDLLRCYENQEFLLCSDGQMSEYQWDDGEVR